MKDREKQIDDIGVRLLRNPYVPMSHDKADILAQYLYNEGIRKQSGWVSVKERLPGESCECLGVSRTGVIYLFQYSCRYKAFNASDYDDGDKWKVEDITHWMPLPEPPTDATDTNNGHKTKGEDHGKEDGGE